MRSLSWWVRPSLVGNSNSREILLPDLCCPVHAASGHVFRSLIEDFPEYYELCHILSLAEERKGSAMKHLHLFFCFIEVRNTTINALNERKNVLNI